MPGKRRWRLCTKASRWRCIRVYATKVAIAPTQTTWPRRTANINSGPLRASSSGPLTLARTPSPWWSISSPHGLIRSTVTAPVLGCSVSPKNTVCNGWKRRASARTALTPIRALKTTSTRVQRSSRILFGPFEYRRFFCVFLNLKLVYKRTP